VLPSGLPEAVADEEVLARFLTTGSHYSSEKRLVKASAFMPEEIHRETSVFRHPGLPVAELRQLGANVIPPGSERRLHGAAFLKAASVRRAQLDVVALEPPARHAAIRGWPWSEPDPRLRKGLHKELANDLASAAGSPVLFPAPDSR
jgi:hypothetical protein